MMKKETADKILSLRRPLLALALLFAVAFLVFSILGLAGVLSPTTAAMLAIGSLILFSLLFGILQSPVSAALAKKDFILTALLLVCFLVVLVLRLTGLMA